MKKVLLILWGSFLLAFAGMAQENPVKWTCSVNYLDGDQAELVMKAEVGGGYHLYSQFMQEGGPQATVFHFPAMGEFKVKGKVSESPKPIEETDEILERWFVSSPKTPNSVKKSPFKAKRTSRLPPPSIIRCAMMKPAFLSATSI